MSTEKELLDIMNEKSDYDNFSEEVKILNRTTVGEMTLYTVSNKNSGVTFQKVPGNPGIQDRGIMGFVNGDRARPVILSGVAAVSESESDAIDPGLPVVDIEQSECDVDVSYVQTGAYTIEITMQYLPLLTTVETVKRGYHINFGNGHQYYTESSDADPHTFEYKYNDIGSYSITVTAWAIKSDAASDIGTTTIPANLPEVVGATISGSLITPITASFFIAPYDWVSHFVGFATEDEAWDDFDAKGFGVTTFDFNPGFMLSTTSGFPWDEYFYHARKTEYSVDLTSALLSHPNILILQPFEPFFDEDNVNTSIPDSGNQLRLDVNGVAGVSVSAEQIRWRNYSTKTERIHSLGVVTTGSTSVLYTDSNNHGNKLTPVPAFETPQKTLHSTNNREPVFIPFHCKAERTILVAVS